jgi:hypothetical protein
LILAGLCAGLAVPALIAQTSIRTAKISSSRDSVDIEVEASDRIVPQTQVLAGPDRLVIDFPNAVPGNQLRSQSVDRGQVKDVRFALYQSRPPVTRIVIDLKTAQSYQIFPAGRSVIIRVMGGGTEPAILSTDATSSDATHRAGLVIANYTTRAEPIPMEPVAKPPLEVTYHNGLLGIHSDKATLSEVLFMIHQRTGADISIPAGAEQEKVVAAISPGPAAEVMARLLNGSRFNFLILSTADDPQRLDKVILTARTDVGPAPLQQVAEPQNNNDDAPVVDDEPAYLHTPPNNGVAPVEVPPRPEPETKTSDDQEQPQQ